MTGRWLWPLLLAPAAACGREPAAPSRPSAIAAVSGAPKEAAHDAVGVVVADQVADVAPPFAGVLMRVNVRAGDAVTAGQVVAELDPRPLEEEIRVAEAALGAAEAARREAMIDIDDARNRLALETKAVAAGVSSAAVGEAARLAVERAEAASQRATADVAAGIARLGTSRNHLTASRLIAPFSGRVAIRYLDAGAMLPSGRAVVRVLGDRRLRLRFAIEPALAARMSPGVEVNATVDTVASTMRAVVRQVSPALDPASGMLFVEAELQESGDTAGTLRPGLAATVRVPQAGSSPDAPEAHDRQIEVAKKVPSPSPASRPDKQ
jgi:RND family efflux transporter MFP subunit